MFSSLRLLCGFALFFAVGACDRTSQEEDIHATGIAATTSPRPSQMLRLNLSLSPEGVTIVSKHVAPNSTNRRDPHRNSETFALALDRNGEVIARRGFRLETERRSEIEGPNGVMLSERVALDKPVFTLAIPLHADTSVVRLMRKKRGQTDARATLLGEVVP